MRATSILAGACTNTEEKSVIDQPAYQPYQQRLRGHGSVRIDHPAIPIPGCAAIASPPPNSVFERSISSSSARRRKPVRVKKTFQIKIIEPRF
jgi:hypothetical protein